MNLSMQNNNKRKWIIAGIVIVILALFLIFRHRHVFLPATCMLPETCSCGETRGEALGHFWTDATCTEAKTCNRCGETDGEALGHDFAGESCTEDIKCSRCGDILKALGHDFADATCTEAKTCSRCGETDGKALGHDYVQGKCSRCNLEIGSLEEISQIKGLKAKCETDMGACLVNVVKDANPYDVVYDYGENYDELVKYADWSLIFDAEYYKKTFPMLAMLYHNDDELLLKHFQTVGIHEGRQGSETFNVGAYMMNCARNVYDAFNDGDVKNYECYYFYYMYNYDREKSVDTANLPDGRRLIKQYRYVMTAVQRTELSNSNDYRRKAGSEDLAGDSELDAIANYRAYINQTEGWVAHGWAENNNPIIYKWIDKYGSATYAENEVEGAAIYRGEVCATKYYYSPEHKETLLANKYKYVGMSNTYTGSKKNDRGFVRYNFDVYFTNVSTPLHS